VLWEKAGLFIDLYHFTQDKKNLLLAETAMTEARKETISADSDASSYSPEQFISSYYSWTSGKNGIHSLIRELPGSIYGRYFYRKRKVLLALIPVSLRSGLKAAELELQGGNISVPLYFSTVLGRGKGLLADELAMDNACSRIHAILKVGPDLSLELSDEGSTNGTFLNGKKLDMNRKATVNNNDVITLGKTSIHVIIPDS
jgi:hypothetical protein